MSSDLGENISRNLPVQPASSESGGGPMLASSTLLEIAPVGSHYQADTNTQTSIQVVHSLLLSLEIV